MNATTVAEVLKAYVTHDSRMDALTPVVIALALEHKTLAQAQRWMKRAGFGFAFMEARLERAWTAVHASDGGA